MAQHGATAQQGTPFLVGLDGTAPVPSLRLWACSGSPWFGIPPIWHAINVCPPYAGSAAPAGAVWLRYGSCLGRGLCGMCSGCGCAVWPRRSAACWRGGGVLIRWEKVALLLQVYIIHCSWSLLHCLLWGKCPDCRWGAGVTKLQI